MDQVRYYAALLLVMFAPGGLLYWFSIHPLIRFWRRVGPQLTLTIHCLFIVVVAWILFGFREPLLSVEFGTHTLLVAAGALLLAVGIVLRVKISRHLDMRILSGLPELDPAGRGVPLLTEGMYAKVRHPRYLELMLSLLAWSLFTNYLANYVLCALTVVVLCVVIPLEEKELRERYGSAYDEYRARVPRLIPRLMKRD